MSHTPETITRIVTRYPQGNIDLPASKSVAHRAIISASLAQGKSVIKNFSMSQDMEATIRCMSAFGSSFSLKGNTLTITRKSLKKDCRLDCGESGSTLRFLIPLALYTGSGVFTGRGRLMERPLTPYLDCLTKHGGTLALKDDVLTVSGTLTPGEYVLPGNVSSQYISGLLFALPLLYSDSRIRLSTPLESASYVDITLDILKTFGISISHTPDYQEFLIPGNQKYTPSTITLEADYSQAAFFLVSAALGQDCICHGLRMDSKQGDKKILDIIRNAGAKIITMETGGLRILPPKQLLPQVIDASDIPDLVPPVAVLLAVSHGESRIINAGRLRLKECDRLEAVTSELNHLGAQIIIKEDSLIIHGKPQLQGGYVDAHNDHRIAMMAATASIVSENPVIILDSGCVCKSYPTFFDDFCKTPQRKGAEI